jgi:2'-5' RNA ligase
METWRSFIAIELPEPVKGELGALQERLRAACACPAAWTAPGSMHLTLCFLGDIDPAKIESIRQVMELACHQFVPFSLILEGTGVFPNAARPRVVWAGLKGEMERLTRLQRDLWQGLSTLGFKPESRPFSPHLTLARLREGASPAQAAGLVTALKGMDSGRGNSFQVNQIHLIRSRLTPAGALYSTLASCALGSR